ncbi:carboxysome peptide A [Marssonina coronariae]|uniref:Carboxysome peptide A n=1 Tax=Diplocarpon coronariae TaxID=2795749 RepID=A0A218ZE86_9HELO|nr:carboxysome peptide A [Marssonina coronariae]
MGATSSGTASFQDSEDSTTPCFGGQRPLTIPPAARNAPFDDIPEPGRASPSGTRLPLPAIPHTPRARVRTTESGIARVTPPLVNGVVTCAASPIREPGRPAVQGPGVEGAVDGSDEAFDRLGVAAKEVVGEHQPLHLSRKRPGFSPTGCSPGEWL